MAVYARAPVGCRTPIGPVKTARQTMKATARIFGLRSNMELTPDTRVADIVRPSPDPTPVQARGLL